MLLACQSKLLPPNTMLRGRERTAAVAAAVAVEAAEQVQTVATLTVGTALHAVAEAKTEAAEAQVQV